MKISKKWLIFKKKKNRNYTNGRVYLRAALREPIIAILENDLLNFEIEPLKVYQALPPSQKSLFRVPIINGAPDVAFLTKHEKMKEILDQGKFI